MTVTVKISYRAEHFFPNCHDINQPHREAKEDYYIFYEDGEEVRISPDEPDAINKAYWLWRRKMNNRP